MQQGQPVADGTGKPAPDDERKIRQAIRAKYAEVARSAAGRFPYPTGRAGAEKLGYDQALLDRTPAGLFESFCGVGNPFSLGGIHPGLRVLDFGCGAGFDMFAAAAIVGPAGLVCGIDLTAEMAHLALENLHTAGLTNCEIRHIDEEDIPYADDFFDVIISNGVINLSPCKKRCFRELYRVLRPGGEIHLADVILETELPPQITGSIEAWSQ